MFGISEKAYCRGGVFLTVITTSHAPFAMKSRMAGKKYLLTGMW
jgi:hypothetical protein